MKTVINAFHTMLEQAASVLADLKPYSGGFSQAKDKVDFPFGMVSEFDYNASVRRKTTERS